MSPKKLKSGDIFWEKYLDKYFFSRVLLDTKVIQKKKELSPSGILDSNVTSDNYIVEVFRGIYNSPIPNSFERLFIGSFSSRFHHGKRYQGEGWQLLKNTPIIPEQIDFPEEIQRGERYTDFQLVRGELRFSTKLSEKEGEELTAQTGLNSFVHAGLLQYALLLQGKGIMIPNGETPVDWELSDLKFNPKIRNKIYEQIGEDPNLSYFDLSLKHGKDIRRFF